MLRPVASTACNTKRLNAPVSLKQSDRGCWYRRDDAATSGRDAIKAAPIRLGSFVTGLSGSFLGEAKKPKSSKPWNGGSYLRLGVVFLNGCARWRKDKP